MRRCGNAGNTIIEGVVYHMRTLLSIATSRLDGLQKASLLLQCMRSLHRQSRRHTRQGTTVFKQHGANRLLSLFDSSYQIRTILLVFRQKINNHVEPC